MNFTLELNLGYVHSCQLPAASLPACQLPSATSCLFHSPARADQSSVEIRQTYIFVSVFILIYY